MSHSKPKAVLSTIASLSLFAACASSPPPTARMAAAESSVRAARDMGGEQVPNAQIQLKRADDQIAFARKLSKNGDNAEADVMLQRAAADANLAAAYVKESDALQRAQAARAQVGLPTTIQQSPESPGPVYLRP